MHAVDQFFFMFFCFMTVVLASVAIFYRYTMDGETYDGLYSLAATSVFWIYLTAFAVCCLAVPFWKAELYLTATASVMMPIIVTTMFMALRRRARELIGLPV